MREPISSTDELVREQIDGISKRTWVVRRIDRFWFSHQQVDRERVEACFVACA
jgi:hypothetical protein